MESQTTARQTEAETALDNLLSEAEYAQEDIVNLRLPRKRIALLDAEINLATLPKRKPYVAATSAVEEAA